MIATVKLSKLFAAKSGTSKQGTPYTIQEMIFTVCKKDGAESYDKLFVTCRDAMYVNNPAFAVGITGVLTYYSNVEEFVRHDGTTGCEQRNVFKSWQTLSAFSIPANIAQAAEQKRLEAIANKPEQEDDEDNTPF